MTQRKYINPRIHSSPIVFPITIKSDLKVMSAVNSLKKKIKQKQETFYKKQKTLSES